MFAGVLVYVGVWVGGCVGECACEWVGGCVGECTCEWVGGCVYGCLGECGCVGG